MREIENGTEHPLLLRALNNLAVAFVDLGRREEAETVFRRALGIAEKRLGSEHPVYGTILLNYASFLRRIGRRENAVRMEARAKQVLRASALRNGAGMTIDATDLRGR